MEGQIERTVPRCKYSYNTRTPVQAAATSLRASERVPALIVHNKQASWRSVRLSWASLLGTCMSWLPIDSRWSHADFLPESGRLTSCIRPHDWWSSWFSVLHNFAAAQNCMLCKILFVPRQKLYTIQNTWLQVTVLRSWCRIRMCPPK
jgi:hypothetical protein